MAKYCRRGWLAMTGGALLVTAAAQGQEYPNEPPWRWHMKPQALAVAVKGPALEGAEHELPAFLCELLGEEWPDHLDAKIISEPIPFVVVRNPEGLTCRLVGFDQAGARIEFDPGGMVGHPDIRLYIKRAKLGDRVIKFLGVEELSLEGKRILASKAAEALQRQGIRLPFPEEGKAYPLSIGGTPIKPSEFKGKVVLIHWWASWCGPCMSELGWLHQLAIKHEQEDLQIVSLSFDDSRKKAEQALLGVVAPDPIAARMRELGVTWDATSAHPRGALLGKLRDLGVHIDGPAAERAVIEVLAKLGVDPDRPVASENLVEMALGKKGILHVVPPDQQELYFKAVGREGVPQLFMVDQRGILRHQGYHLQEDIERLVSSLLDAPAE